MTIDSCRVYYSTLVNEGGTVVLEDGGVLISTHAGDLNGDGDVTPSDIPIFAAVLVGTDTDPMHLQRADANGDSQRDGRDVNPFVALLLAP